MRTCYPSRLGFFSLNAGDNSVEYIRLCLFDRRDGIVDCERRLPLQPLGMFLGVLCTYLLLELGNLCIPSVPIGSDFCFQGIPMAGNILARGLDILI